MKMYNYVIISVGMALVFELAGIHISGVLFDWLGLSLTGPLLWINTSFYLVGLGAIALIGIGGAIISGRLGSGMQPENFILIPFLIASAAAFTVPMLGIVAWVWTNVGGWIATITSFLIGMMTVGFTWSAVEWFRGTD